MDDRTRQLLDRMVAASGRLDGLVAGLPAQLRETQAALRQERQRELEAFQQALAASVQDMQRQSNRILAQAVRGAWLALAALAGAGILLFLAALWLLGREADRLQAARERADAVELQAEVLEALRQVEISSCGGRACIRVDARAPTWRNGDGEYVLVDGR